MDLDELEKQNFVKITMDLDQETPENSPEYYSDSKYFISEVVSPGKNLLFRMVIQKQNDTLNCYLLQENSKNESPDSYKGSLSPLSLHHFDIFFVVTAKEEVPESQFEHGKDRSFFKKFRYSFGNTTSGLALGFENICKHADKPVNFQIFFKVRQLKSILASEICKHFEGLVKDCGVEQFDKTVRN